jgi:hypothetical protein
MNWNMMSVPDLATHARELRAKFNAIGYVSPSMISPTISPIGWTLDTAKQWGNANGYPYCFQSKDTSVVITMGDHGRMFQPWTFIIAAPNDDEASVFLFFVNEIDAIYAKMLM